MPSEIEVRRSVEKHGIEPDDSIAAATTGCVYKAPLDEEHPQRRQLHHPDRPADGADGRGLPPIWPMLLARTAETGIGAFAALVVITVGYVRKYPEVVLQRR